MQILYVWHSFTVLQKLSGCCIALSFVGITYIVGGGGGK